MRLSYGPRRDHYVLPQIDRGALAAQDPDEGVLCFSTYWRPDPRAPDPEMPGLKAQIHSLIPLLPDEPCLCGSGKAFGECCRQLPKWRVVCENYDRTTFSILRAALARFQGVDGDHIEELLDDDTRLRCVEESPARRFWLYDGDPCYETRYGIQTFGDIELRDRKTVTVTALSETRMEFLLCFLKEVTGLDLPEIKIDPPILIDKPGARVRGGRPKPGTARRKKR